MGDNKISDDVIRDVFLRNGFTIKEGQSDLKPYVYSAARELIANLQGEAVPVAWQVRDEVGGWKWCQSDQGCYQMVKRHRPHDARALYEHPQPAEQSLESWSREMTAKEAGQYVSAGAHGIEDTPAEQNEVSGGHELARAVEKALGNRDGKRDAELDALLEMAMQELNEIDTSLPDEVSGYSGEMPPEEVTLKQVIDGYLSIYGSLRQAAELMCIDPAYLSRLAGGSKTNPSDEVLEKLGLERRVVYTRKVRDYQPTKLHLRTKCA